MPIDPRNYLGKPKYPKRVKKPKYTGPMIGTEGDKKTARIQNTAVSVAGMLKPRRRRKP